MPLVNSGGGGGVSGLAVSLVWKLVDLTAQVTGATSSFDLGLPFVAGTVMIFYDTTLQNSTAGFLTETDPSAGLITTGIVIPAGKTLFASFLKDEAGAPP